MLRDIFLQLAAKTFSGTTLPATCWQEIEDRYSAPGRHYHTLHHLESLWAALQSCRHLLQDYDTALYAMFYHDIIYDASRSDNEAQSADLAAARMQALSVTADMQERCHRMILATRTHQLHDDEDINLFTDADLTVLGWGTEAYKAYCRQIRMEYAIYPDELYQPGRAKVLQHFLDMPGIFKTAHFKDRYEDQARYNIRAELESLS